MPDGSLEHRDINSDEILGPVVLPSFYEAGALTNKPISDVAPCDYKMIVVAPASPQLLRKVRSVGVDLTVNSMTFAQMLAKIALGTAVAKFGVSGFQPLVREFILERPGEYGHWVGGFAGMDHPKMDTLHFIHLSTIEAEAGTFIIVRIRLFAEFGGPENYVVVGRPL